jgi:Tol biopolymer transport system component
MVGQILSHYRILRVLGAGGMGEVFLAEDMKLGRQVALKILARDSAHDPDRRARFEREARAVAALNHPGIVTIHSVEEDQGLLFITMELVEGKTLSEIVPGSGMPLDQLLKISIPLTDAVAAAHQRGITHRDLKPANVMIGHDGRVKVLDFGLAKQQAQEALQTETALQPTAHATAEGKILGTVAYMSPEQAQGKPIDQRSDIFSLGVVLFEMATGQRPFKGDSSVSVLSSVLKDTPPLVTDLRPEFPREIARIVRHCLTKDPEERYQSAKDLRNDLKALKEDTDSGELAPKSATSVTPASGISGPATAVSSGVAPRRAGRWIAAGLGMVVLLGGVAAVALWASAPRPPRVVATRQITTDGVQKNPPVTDGARLYFRIAHLRGGGDEGAALAQVAASGGDTVQLTATSPALLDIDSAGTELLVSRGHGTGDADLGVMPVLGGIERPVGDIRINNVGEYGHGATWTPDKSHIVYAKGNELRLVRSDGSESRTLVTAPGIPFAPRVSPDGGQLRYSVHDAKTGTVSLWEAGADGANQHPLLPGWSGAHETCCGTWTRDGRYYVFEADGNIWAQSEPRGVFRRRATDPVQLTFGPLLFSGVMPSRDGKTLFAIGDQRKGRLVRYDPKTKQFVEYLGGLSAEGVAVSPDGAWVVYTAYPEGTLWRSRLDGSERVQLTFPPMLALLPRWSPDGSRIAFFAGTSPESWRVYTVASTGGTPRRATTGTTTEADPSWSPDGRHIAFGSTSGGQAGTTPDTTIQVVDLGTGQMTPLPGSKGFFSPRWSPDGRSILGLSLDSSRMVIFDVATQKWTDLAPPGAFYGWPSWSSDSAAVTFYRGARNDEMGRVTIADRRVETFANLTALHLLSGFLGPWYGSTPDNWPLVLLDAGTHDIYALDWDAP